MLCVFHGNCQDGFGATIFNAYDLLRRQEFYASAQTEVSGTVRGVV